jgi:hypothetical protein
VRYEVDLPDCIEVDRCNCSICTKAGNLHLIVPKSRFRLLSGEDDLSCYRFNTGVAAHYFCSYCGIKSFYIPRSNPDGISVTANCLDKQPPQVVVVDFDGQHWEDNAHRLAHKSLDGASQPDDADT